MVSSGSNGQPYSDMTSALNFHPIDTKNLTGSKKVAAGSESVKENANKKIGTQGIGKDKQEKGKNKMITHTPAMFLAAKPKKDTKAATAKDEDDGLGDQSDAEEGGFVVNNPTSLIDIKLKSEPSINNNKGGRPMNSLLDILLQKCYHESAPEKHLFRCVGGCGMTYINRNLNRTVHHATACHRLPADICTRAKEHAANKALSRKLAASDPEVEVDAGGEPTIKESGQKESKDVGGVIAVKKRKLNNGVASNSKTTKLFEQAKKLGRKERHEKIDLVILILVCCAGIPTFITQQNVWKDVFSLADPTYVPASRAKLEEVQIVGEAESIQQIQIAYLKTQNNITVSCDGGTTRGRKAFWTLHMSTEDRKVYLMDVREATAESHTAVWIKSYVLEACLSHSKYSLRC